MLAGLVSQGEAAAAAAARAWPWRVFEDYARGPETQTRIADLSADDAAGIFWEHTLEISLDLIVQGTSYCEAKWRCMCVSC